MTVTSGCVKLKKDAQNLVGISIGGGAPYCPCLYVVQIFDSTPASEDGSLQAGDEITGVNGMSVKGKTKVEAARLIQSFKDEVIINYNKLHADPKQGKTLDLILKKVKHRIVETMESSTADALGLSRAILVNDGMVKKLEELNKTSNAFSGMVNHAKNLLRAIYELSRVYAVLGDTFSEIGVKEPMACTSEAFTQFGTIHRSMERFSIEMLKKIKPMITDLNTFLRKAVPDTKLTIKKYLDVKFEYLSYCLKVKEMDDEEYGFAMVQEPLYRVETGNYEYRLVLRCRQDARTRFAKMRNDVLVKLELLDNKHGHANIVKFPTRLDKTLDLVFINDEEIYEVRRRAPIMNSDHCIIRILPKIYSRSHFNIFSNLSKKTQQRCYSQENMLKLRCMLNDTNWELFNEQKLDDTISNLTDYLKFCLDICCPKQIIFKRMDRFSSPHLKKLRREKEKLYKTKNKSGLKKINTQIKSEIKRLNNIYNQTILSCKTSENIWKLFREITGCGKHNNFASSIDVNTLNRSFIRPPNVLSAFNLTNNTTSDFHRFNTSDVLKCLKSLKPSQSLGPDGIPAIVLKKCADILSNPLTSIFNTSFSNNNVPSLWKDIKIIPVPKSGSGDSVKFRPIAITSPFLKLMEKLLLQKLIPSLSFSNDPKQFAYKQGRSTLDAAAVFHHNIVSSLDKGAKYVRCTFLDYTSAFDSVPRGLLLNKLSLTQTESWAINWLHSYFSNRMQYTVYNGVASSPLLTEAGVPQGAVLSPFLFSFFLHDLPLSDEINFVKYADDLTVSLPVKSQSDCFKLNSFLSDISQWSKLNGLTLNPSKCQTVDFSFRHKRDLQTLVSTHDVCRIEGTIIETKSNAKYLGLVISSDLTWSSHIQMISKKVFRLTYYIKKLRLTGVPQPLLSQFVNSRILPILLYCSPLVFPGLLKKDYTILRRMLKVVSRTSGVKLSQLVTTLVDKHLNTCEKWSKTILSDPQHPLYSQLSPCISSGRTRNQYKIIYARTTKYRNSTIPYLARVLSDRDNVKRETYDLLCC
nr:unnamed protein product [Trichobilharzia regenti]